MKKYFILLCCFSSLCGLSQVPYNFVFATTKDSVSKNEKKETVHAIVIRSVTPLPVRLGDYKLSIIPAANSTLPSTDYEIPLQEFRFSSLKDSVKAFIVLKADSLEDRRRTLFLDLQVHKNDGTIDTIKYTKYQLDIISVKKKVDTSINYNYLIYVGTNFDLVDGIEAKNLFFAANMLIPQDKEKNRVGAYLSLYGNRTMTTTDSTGNAIHTYKLRGVTDSSFWEYRQQAKLTRTSVSDNLGAYFSPLIKLWKPKALHLYYSPSLEFVFRRTTTTSTYSNGKNQDSTLIFRKHNGSIEFSSTSTLYSNEFSVNYSPIGLFLVHDTKDISMRVHASVGWCTNYYPVGPSILNTDVSSRGYRKQKDMFFSGRAWISEASTGITLQGEVTNNLNYPKPFYGVTLSKAFNFSNFGKIFQPLTSRISPTQQ